MECVDLETFLTVLWAGMGLVFLVLVIAAALHDKDMDGY